MQQFSHFAITELLKQERLRKRKVNYESKQGEDSVKLTDSSTAIYNDKMKKKQILALQIDRKYNKRTSINPSWINLHYAYAWNTFHNEIQIFAVFRVNSKGHSRAPFVENNWKECEEGKYWTFPL